MPKVKTLILFLSVLIKFLLCPAIAQHSVNTLGGEAQSASGTMSYTIGQIDFTFFGSSQGVASLGVQQPYRTVIAVPDADLSCIIYPNPAYNAIQIKGLEGLFDLSFFDLNGISVRRYTDMDVSQTLYLEGLPPGMYVGRIQNEQGQVWTCRIIKVTR